MNQKKQPRRIPAASVPLVDTPREQVEAWVQGRNLHVRVGQSYECCPDFSCCYPDCAVPLDVRRRFARADSNQRMTYYSKFLAAFVRHVSPDPLDVHLVGAVPREGQNPAVRVVPEAWPGARRGSS